MFTNKHQSQEDSHAAAKKTQVGRHMRQQGEVAKRKGNGTGHVSASDCKK